jgi:hypothetical protein
VFIQKSGSLISAGISGSIVSALAIFIWRIHSPEFRWFWPRVYLSGMVGIGFFLYLILRAIFGT